MARHAGSTSSSTGGTWPASPAKAPSPTGGLRAPSSDLRMPSSAEPASAPPPQSALQHMLCMLRGRPMHVALMLAQQRALLRRTPAPMRRSAGRLGLLGALPAEDAVQLASVRHFLAQFSSPAGAVS
ncbi:hypothetical protein ABPG75_011828 [Micractinium tetrahymenae]